MREAIGRLEFWEIAGRPSRFFWRLTWRLL